MPNVSQKHKPALLGQGSGRHNCVKLLLEFETNPIVHQIPSTKQKAAYFARRFETSVALSQRLWFCTLNKGLYHVDSLYCYKLDNSHRHTRNGHNIIDKINVLYDVYDFHSLHHLYHLCPWHITLFKKTLQSSGDCQFVSVLLLHVLH